MLSAFTYNTIIINYFLILIRGEILLKKQINPCKFKKTMLY